MDAPKGRYRIEEIDRRLVVIDTATGDPASAPGPVRPIVHEPGLLDRLGRAMLHLVVQSWDRQGRAILAWEWEQSGRTRRWNATLDPAQQRRLGRALLNVSAFPFLILLFVLGMWVLWPLAFFALPATLRGVWAILRLKRETGGERPPIG